jgi:hypothetical protein
VIARALRWTAIAIAIVAAIDPPVTLAGRGRSRVAIVTPDPTVDAARTTRETLTDLLRPEFDLVSGPDGTADAAIVIGTDYLESPPADRQRVFTITLPPTSRDTNVRVSAGRAPRTAPPGTLIHIEVDVDGANVSGATSTISVRSGSSAVEVGRASHSWTSNGERWRAALDVTPTDQPPWRFRVEVPATAGEKTVADNIADVLVAAAEPFDIIVYEPRLSWAGTFVRRALEHDPRFSVAPTSFPARGNRLPTIADKTRAVVVGGLDRMTAADAAALMRFMNEQGGTVVLLPDSRADLQTVSRWLPVPDSKEVLLERPTRLSVGSALPAIQASELLTFERTPASLALATTGSSAPAVAVLPVGAGQLLISGALDAWRFRANDNDAFDRFWQSAVGGLAAAVQPAIDVEIVPAVVPPDAKAAVLVRVRRAALRVSADTPLPVSATSSTGDVVRLWPGDEPDTFHGSFTAPGKAGNHRIVVTANSQSGAGTFLVTGGARAARPAGPPLSLLAESRGGQDIAVRDVATMAKTLRQSIASPTVRVERRPMRSAWWLVPFAACLGGEWLLRRRRGER